jgi:hypothetical protein
MKRLLSSPELSLGGAAVRRLYCCLASLLSLTYVCVCSEHRTILHPLVCVCAGGGLLQVPRTPAHPSPVPQLGQGASSGVVFFFFVTALAVA